MSTYAEIFIGLSPVLSGLIQKYSRESLSKQNQLLPITILSPVQISQALFHPQNRFLKEIISTAYVASRKVDHNMIKAQSDADNQQFFIRTTLNTLEEKKRSLPPDAKQQQQAIEHTKNSLEQQYKALNHIQENLEQVSSKYASTGSEIDDLAIRQDAEWVAYREDLLNQLQKEIENVTRDAGLPPLPQGEIDNLMRQDLQDVLDRFTDLGATKDLPPAELEKILGLKKQDFETYFKMKAYLAIRSVLASREKMGSYMSKLDSFFQHARSQGQQLFDRQSAETAALDHKVTPILETAAIINSELKQLAIDQEALINASPIDIHVIRDRIAEVTRLPEPQRGPR